MWTSGGFSGLTPDVKDNYLGDMSADVQTTSGDVTTGNSDLEVLTSGCAPDVYLFLISGFPDYF